MTTSDSSSNKPGSGDLRSARERAFDLIFDAVVVTDNQGTIVDWNAGAEKLYGWPRDEALGQPVHVLHVPEDEAEMTARVFAGIERDGYWTGELRRRNRDGSIGWIESLVVPLVDADGVQTGALGINRDISPRKASEAERIASERRWRALLENSPDGIVVVDAAGTVQLVNGRAEQLFGYERAELIGQPIEVLLPAELQTRHQGHRRAFLERMQSRRMGGGRVLRGRRRDGTLVPLDISLSMLEVDGQAWVMSIVHDLSVRERITEQLRVLSAALSAAANGVAISNPEGICEWVNPAFTEVTGYAAEEIVGRPLSVLKSGVHDRAFFAELWATISAGEPWHGEITNRHRDGHLYVEEQTIAPVLNAAGEITHFVAIKQDISSRRQIEDELRRTNEALSQKLEEIEALQARLRDMAMRDPLTDLYNRRYLADTLERELARTQRAGEPLAVVIMDLDHFKAINDTHGHAAGDDALIRVAEMLGRRVRKGDIVCRYGGEEFVVVMPGATLERAAYRAEEWRRAAGELSVGAGETPTAISMSLGVAVAPAHGETSHELLRVADEALYRAKQAGRNRVYTGEAVR